jgi:hypothetical protein
MAPCEVQPCSQSDPGVRSREAAFLNRAQSPAGLPTQARLNRA